MRDRNKQCMDNIIIHIKNAFSVDFNDNQCRHDLVPFGSSIFSLQSVATYLTSNIAI